MARTITPCEIRVIKRLGMTDPEIAMDMNVMLTTVRSYIRRIFYKLGVERRTQAVVKAIQKGIVEPDEFIFEAENE